MVKWKVFKNKITSKVVSDMGKIFDGKICTTQRGYWCGPRESNGELPGERKQRLLNVIIGVSKIIRESINMV